jgi:diguanylate cyclase (GGDEF)-like protein
MRRALAGLALLLVSLSALAAPSAVLLRDELGTIDAEALPQVWIDAEGKAAVEDVTSPLGAGRFTPASADTIYSLGPRANLWMHLRVARGRDERQGWLIEFPMPLLDTVTVYQRDGNRWRSETAGDTLAVAQWPEPARHPYFRLDVPAGQVRDVYVRIRHTTSANFPVRLSTELWHDQRIQHEYLGLGATFGALLLLIAACLAQSWVYRDRVYAWYSIYALLTTLAVAAYTGVAAHLLWPGFGALGDAPEAMLAYVAAASALLFVRHLIGAPRRFQVIDRWVYGLGVVGLVLAVTPPFLPKLTGLGMLGAYVVLAVVVNMGLAIAAWRRGDVVGQWVFAAYVPLTISVLLSVARMYGWVPLSFGTQYAVVVAMALEVPLLLVALSIRSRERHGAQIREQALSTQDALTGLLAPHLFHDRMQQVVTRYRREKESAAVMFIDLVNYTRIKDYYGSAVAEQSLLRSVIKLRRLLRDVDTVSRIGEARFGVILEGVDSRTAVTDRAARLIAAGLMPLKGLKPDVTLQFHIASVLLDERIMDAPELVESLSELLAGMSPRTRRPIRFLQAEDTHPAPLADSSMMDEDSQLPSRPDNKVVAINRS